MLPAGFSVMPGSVPSAASLASPKQLLPAPSTGYVQNTLLVRSKPSLPMVKLCDFG